MTLANNTYQIGLSTSGTSEAKLLNIKISPVPRVAVTDSLSRNAYGTHTRPRDDICTYQVVNNFPPKLLAFEAYSAVR